MSFSWQSGCFRYQRSAVRNQTTPNYYRTFIYCQLYYIKKTKIKVTEADNLPFLTIKITQSDHTGRIYFFIFAWCSKAQVLSSFPFQDKTQLCCSGFNQAFCTLFTFKLHPDQQKNPLGKTFFVWKKKVVWGFKYNKFIVQRSSRKVVTLYTTIHWNALG